MHYIVKKKFFVKKIAIFVQQIFLDDHGFTRMILKTKNCTSRRFRRSRRFS